MRSINTPSAWAAITLAALTVPAMSGCEERASRGERAQEAHNLIGQSLTALAAEHEVIGKYLDGDQSVSVERFEEALTRVSAISYDLPVYGRRIREGAVPARQEKR